MSVDVHTYGIKIKFAICALFLLSALPLVVRSQEETPIENSDDTVVTEEATTTEAIVASTLLTNPYSTERLQGDKVFNDFVLAPGKVELEIALGQSKTIEIEVANRTGVQKQFDIDVEDMGTTQDPDTPVVLLGDDTGPYTLKDFISVPQRQFDLDHNLRARIPVTISIPADAEPGGRYGSVLVKTVTLDAQPGDPEKGTAPSSAIVSRIGTLFFITIPGEVETGGGLKEFTAKNNKSWYQSGPVNFDILFENTGSIHLNPYGELRITNMFGDEVGFMQIDPWFTMPKSVRLREITWTREMLYGRYTATVQINRGYDDIVDELSYTFWVIPLKLLGIGLAGVFVIFFIIRGFFRTFEFKRK